MPRCRALAAVDRAEGPVTDIASIATAPIAPDPLLTALRYPTNPHRLLEAATHSHGLRTGRMVMTLAVVHVTPLITTGSVSAAGAKQLAIAVP